MPKRSNRSADGRRPVREALEPRLLLDAVTLTPDENLAYVLGDVGDFQLKFDGVETGRVTVSDTSTAPVAQVVAVGTKARPVRVAVAASPAAAVSGSVDSLNWAALARCESGGRVDAVSSNGLYYGLYQFSVGTWRGVGGSGLPSQASADEQTARAKALYVRSGAGQWPVCGKRLLT